MIKSFNRDPFDAVFFLEEEFGKINSHTRLMNYQKENLIKEIIKGAYSDDIKFTDHFAIRENSIWPSEFEMEAQSKSNSLPTARVYFATGVDLYLDRVVHDSDPQRHFMEPIIRFPSVDTTMGLSFIILEDSFDYFFKGTLYTQYTPEFELEKVSKKDKNLIVVQSLIMKSLIYFMNTFVKRFRLCEKWIDNSPIMHLDSLYSKEEYDYFIDNVLDYTIGDLLFFASFRRYVKNTMISPLTKYEFDKKIMGPVLATYYSFDDELANRMQYPYYSPFNGRMSNSKKSVDWIIPVEVKVFVNVIISILRLLESSNFRNLNNVALRFIAFRKHLRNIDISVYDTNNELEV